MQLIHQLAEHVVDLEKMQIADKEGDVQVLKEVANIRLQANWASKVTESQVC